MKLQLHVWGPAFQLPSIDAQCLATIAYCSLALPKDSWELIATSDPSVSPTSELPALQNGSVFVSRFGNIVDYLRQYSNGQWDLDRDLDESDRADNIAFSSFIESRGQSLLDLYLFVTSQNYYGNTSPAYANILQWPNQWILPPKLHSAAKARTEHLDLSSLDLKALEEHRQREHSAAVAAGKVPKSFITRPRESVSSLLGRTAQQNSFRLEALTAEFFEPLEAMLGDKKHLLAMAGEKSPSSLDCLALGYLSLALVPELTFPWLRDAMRVKAPLLRKYTERMGARCFGDIPVEVAHALVPDSASESPLPWRAPGRVSVAAIGSTLLNTLADSTPIWRDFRMHNRMKQDVESSDAGLSAVEVNTISSYADARNKDLMFSIAAVIGGAFALVGYSVYSGLITFQTQDQYVEEEQFEEANDEALINSGSATEKSEEDTDETSIDLGSATDFLGNLNLGRLSV